MLCELDSLLTTSRRIKETLPGRNHHPFVVPQVLRDLKHKSDRSTRNFRIIKDYVRTLEYVLNNLIRFLHWKNTLEI